MRHRVAHRKLGRTTSHRKALLKNLSIALTKSENIETTVEKAKELYQNFGDYFYRDQRFLNLLNKYESAVEKSNEMMSHMKSFEECYCKCGAERA